MFLIFGFLIVGTLALIGLGCLIAASRAATSKGKGAAPLWALPAIFIGGLFMAGVLWGNYAAEGYPNKIFTEVFDVPSPKTVTHLRAYSDDDELNPVLLQFEAPPATVKTLLSAQFRPIANSSAFGPLAKAQAFALKPAWFDTTLNSNALVYELARQNPGSGHVAIYDASLNRVRIYLDNPIPLHFR